MTGRQPSLMSAFLPLKKTNEARGRDGRKEESPGGGTDDENAANVCSADVTNDASTDRISSTTSSCTQPPVPDPSGTCPSSTSS